MAALCTNVGLLFPPFILPPFPTRPAAPAKLLSLRRLCVSPPVVVDRSCGDIASALLLIRLLSSSGASVR